MSTPDDTLAVRELRAALDLTQENFARRLGVTLRTVTRWEKGDPIPVESLAKLYHASSPFPSRQSFFLRAVRDRLGFPI